MIIIVGGPAGSGKSTVGSQLADQLHAPFLEGDALHPTENVEKMSHGIPLTDEDRWGWLEKVAVEAKKEVAKSETDKVIVACSSLKKSYRDFLREKIADVREKVLFVFIAVEEAELLKRVSHRQNHFMKANMVHSQLEIMQVPEPDEPNCIVYWNLAVVSDIVDRIHKIERDDEAGNPGSNKYTIDEPKQS